MKSKLKLKNLKKIFPFVPRSNKWYASALIHPSYRNENAVADLENFDRLEFFGDAILNFVICRKLYDAFPQANEGLLSRLRSILVSKKILCRIAREIKLSRHLKIGKSLKDQPDFSNKKILADTLEALIAAMYFDQGFDRTAKFILNIFRSYFDARRLLRLDPNPKSTLQELSQKIWKKLPVYEYEMTPKGIKAHAIISSSRRASAVAKGKREAEEKAARILIGKIRQLVLRRSKKRSSSAKLRKTL